MQPEERRAFEFHHMEELYFWLGESLRAFDPGQLRHRRGKGAVLPSGVLVRAKLSATDEFLIVSATDAKLIASSQGDLSFVHKGGYWNQTEEPEVIPEHWLPVLPVVCTGLI
eukprot:TRINITY_DN19857_c0_g3_i1.p3 TRINITY_DN19857_c0_g3~~TRINITY_DN19857_c0_g3_i1.p3  ORF type:complete len:112 (-),score=16.97 TRINITY_DN19857_c0_g3_i1:67-402(-)